MSEFRRRLMMTKNNGGNPSYTTRGCDGYWDFVGIEDYYFGSIPNKIESSDYVCETYKYKNNANAKEDTTYGIHDEVMLSGVTNYRGGIGYYYETKIYNSQTNAFYRSYPHSIEIYGKVAVGINTKMMSTRISDDKLTVGFGTDFYMNTATELKTAGGIGQGNSTMSVSYIDALEYHHWILELDSKLIKVYLDGVLVGSASPTNNNIGSRATRLVPCPSLVKDNNTELKMIRIYSVLLTDNEVLNNYNQTINTYETIL